MIDLDDLITLDEAGALIGRRPISLRNAAQKGTLEARKLGKTWITTRDAVSRYQAYVAATAWRKAPQHLKRPGGSPRRRRVRRRRAA